MLFLNPKQLKKTVWYIYDYGGNSNVLTHSSNGFLYSLYFRCEKLNEHLVKCAKRNWMTTCYMVTIDNELKNIVVFGD